MVSILLPHVLCKSASSNPHCCQNCSSLLMFACGAVQKPARQDQGAGHGDHGRSKAPRRAGVHRSRCRKAAAKAVSGRSTCVPYWCMHEACVPAKDTAKDARGKFSGFAAACMQFCQCHPFCFSIDEAGSIQGRVCVIKRMITWCESIPKVTAIKAGVQHCAQSVLHLLTSYTVMRVP